MKTASEILQAEGIELRSHRQGNVKSLCPRCSHTRKNKKERCLSVLIDGDGVRWHCFNCEYQGGKLYIYDEDFCEGWDKRKPNSRSSAKRARNLYR